MNRNAIDQALQSIRAAIESARDENGNASLLPNFEAGIRLCDELISIVDTAEDRAVFEQLMGRFDRFVSDSLPWTDRLLTTIDRESKNITNALCER